MHALSPALHGRNDGLMWIGRLNQRRLGKPFRSWAKRNTSTFTVDLLSYAIINPNITDKLIA
ncbi:MAG: hypothetical protein HOH43_14125 [Candidatus Latescibacteria bacterium]|jgi:hypothetical protein|nr:hypothetical protein [Candidatus Latescibacterota bacterium]